MMSLDRYLTKFFYLAVFTVIVGTAFLVGCGGGNNPGGPAVTATPSSVSTIDNSLNAGTASLFGTVVTSNNTPIANVVVKLLVQDISTGNLTDTKRSSTTLTSGEFIFNGLGTGTFVLKIEATNDFLESSKLARIDNAGAIDTGNFTVLSKTPDATIPTLNLKAQAVDALSGKPISVAQISIDTGQTTITNAFGMFELFNVASGTRKLIVSQPGLASYSIFFEVRATAPPSATGVYVNNQLFAVNAAGNTVDLTLPGVSAPIKINPNVHSSAVLAGTVKKFVLVNQVPTADEEAYGGYEFDIWTLEPSTNVARKSHTVLTKTDGTWRLDNLPPFEDNGFLWFAVPVRTQVQVLQGNSGNAVVFTNSASEWADRDPVLAYGYKIAAGQTTIMDFTVPSFVYAKPNPTINNPTNARFTDLAGTTINETSLTTNIQFTWTGPEGINQLTLDFSRVYKNPTVPVVTKTIRYDINEGTSATTVHTRNLKPADYGLDYGRFTWVTKVSDPNVEYTSVSDSTLLTIVPSKYDLSPGENIDGTTTYVKIETATYTVTFAAPLDSETQYVRMELQEAFDANGDGVIDGWAQRSSANEAEINNQAFFNLTYSPNAPGVPVGQTETQYRWRAVYYYDDGPPMFSEWTLFKFRL